MKPEALAKIKYGDYLELKHAAVEGMVFGRVVHISDPQLVYLDRQVVWVQVYPNMDLQNKISWDFNYLSKYVLRVIDGRNEKRMIKLLYDY